jgi:hypothetical protein
MLCICTHIRMHVYREEDLRKRLQEVEDICLDGEQRLENSTEIVNVSSIGP